MRKILVVTGCGIKGGNTDRLSDAFIRGAKEAGHEVEKAFLGELQIEDCRGCGACQVNGHKCVIRDDMQDLIVEFQKADTIVLASPLYFWTVTARLKAFIDRLYAISTNDQYPKKDFALLMTAGDDYPETFTPVLNYYRALVKALNWTNLGEITIGGCASVPGERRIKEEALLQAEQFGKSI